MCGIWASLSKGTASLPDDSAVALLKARGPDSLCSTSCTVSSRAIRQEVPLSSQDFVLTCSSSVLALRGDRVQQQPLVDESTGSTLCWNGEAWKLKSELVSGNDSSQVFQALIAAASSPSSTIAIVEALTNITGPFAFVFFDAISSTIYYGRDHLGRRSLVLQQDEASRLFLCSVAFSHGLKATEVDTGFVHALNVTDGQIKTRRIPWSSVSPSTNRTLPSLAISPSPSTDTVEDLLQRLSSSLRLRVQNVPNHTETPHSANAARVAVLFSGGLDCTLLARMIHDVLPANYSIDLLNVAFENPRTMQAYKNIDVSPYEICPDRRTGRTSFAELSRVCSTRNWRFVAVDVPYTLMLEHKDEIVNLMKPHNTEMDLSIATALYFASRGIGTAHSSHHPIHPIRIYQTTARVLLSGLGADELFGGYSRHAAAFSRGGYAELAAELDLDYQRIGQRNLGRDDRVISCWSKETRYPFLDEDFVNYALSLPVWEKCGFRTDKTVPKHYEDTQQATSPGDLDPAKMLLRLAAWKLGMTGVAAERKRAIQFGAKTAKMEAGGGRKKGTDALQ